MITEVYPLNSEIVIVSIAIVLVLQVFSISIKPIVTTYGDARAHLDIARRVVDSMTPGRAQFGDYWLSLSLVTMSTRNVLGRVSYSNIGIRGAIASQSRMM